MPKRKKKLGLDQLRRCAINGCDLPGIVHLGAESYCLKHIRVKLSSTTRVSTHLDLVGGPQCKTAQETIQAK